MNRSVSGLFYSMGENVVDYLPHLLGGIVLILIGWLLAWIAKRVVFQLCVLLRLDRMVGRFGWARGFAKADIRYAFYNTVGGVAFLIIFFVFLNAAFDAMKLSVLSGLIEKGVYFIPKLIIALVILGLGWMVTGWLGEMALRALRREEVPGASLIARFARLVLLLFFSAMALTELDIARQIVVIGFSVSIITLGALAIVLTIFQGRKSPEGWGKRGE